ncbi:conserved hypothetical protein [Alkaliphilus metalliredigens QYMF]|uniref:Ethanolamine utilization protein EutP n=1 Tax=Alkaliphilus metalliredigens (strain QYMF) TaxID=293826 RepID=A6TUT2_ALKMQ|nr:EutP/PduV family microcompartment system protein [Alkaliphilus metalliredigens]ABR49950.1 conserved hypothetical protein [Alkaliphilus metalliredigens QYMF]
MRKKRVMIIGPKQSGKTSLARILNHSNQRMKKSQDIIYDKNTIDIPSSFIENPSMYKHLIALAQDASHILILVDQISPINLYPPGFAKSFNSPVIGVITKVNKDIENEDLCKKYLKMAGVSEPYYYLNTKEHTGISLLKCRLKLSEVHW